MPSRYVPRHEARHGSGPGGGRAGRHAAAAPPRRPLRSRVALPPRPAQPALAGLLALSLVGGTAALAAADASGPAAGVVATAALTQAQVLDADALAAAEREERAERVSRARVLAPAPAPAAAPAPPPPPPPPPPVLPGCEGRPTSGFANGRIPTSALCELPGTDHHLRADAARAFVRLSAAYEAARGEPLCVTDSYRSYEAQARAKRQKPRLTAAPGRSNHGTGTAVDLCGGVESFRTAAHAWMRANAPQFGWVHPSWAGPRGKRPEPWHWEYRPGA